MEKKLQLSFNAHTALKMTVNQQDVARWFVQIVAASVQNVVIHNVGSVSQPCGKSVIGIKVLILVIFN